jgi:hypothetical protein
VLGHLSIAFGLIGPGQTFLAGDRTVLWVPKGGEGSCPSSSLNTVLKAVQYSLSTVSHSHIGWIYPHHRKGGGGRGSFVLSVLYTVVWPLPSCSHSLGGSMPSKISSVSLLSDSASPSSYDAEQKHEDRCFPFFLITLKNIEIEPFYRLCWGCCSGPVRRKRLPF